MREIKFRAWDRVAENMFIIFDAKEQGEWFLPKWKERYEVMQYTGLKDKNGKEIYEGDIVKCITVSTYSTEEYISEVVWEEDCFIVHESKTVDVPLGLFRQNSEYQNPLSEIKVIGNIYENPGLLEG